jgi:hypothetical protein
MSGLQHAGSFRDLIVYQKSRQLQREILGSPDLFPGKKCFR